MIERVYKVIGARIKEQRKALPMTQEALSDQSGIGRSSLAHIETGSQRVMLHQLYAIASVLECDVANLLPPANTPEPPSRLNTIGQRPNSSQFADIQKLVDGSN
ncbi:MAG: helix-turn-helix transcriptional regulator [Gammaproteobacteria bacterium]|nr:helix-turn-helix transcriptional regulator [Gammaproteobacteria bacterium]MCP5136373.1 helix-turn-helix transcriptional regulator [Gammaproteobacteria bacterium]